MVSINSDYNAPGADDQDDYSPQQGGPATGNELGNSNAPGTPGGDIDSDSGNADENDDYAADTDLDDDIDESDDDIDETDESESSTDDGAQDDADLNGSGV